MSDIETENALWLCDREPRVSMRALANTYRLLEARVKALEAAHATKAELYVTPDHIADFAIGSGAFATSIARMFANPPYTAAEPIDDMPVTGPPSDSAFTFTGNGWLIRNAPPETLDDDPDPMEDV